MKNLRLTLGTKITGTVLLVVLCFGGFVLLTNAMVSSVSNEITGSTVEVQKSNQEANEVLTTVASANEFDGKVVTLLTTQLRMNQLNKLYLATEDAVVQMDHDELAETMGALVEELGAQDERISALREPLTRYLENFLLMDEKIMEQEVEKARQISVTAMDADSGSIVDALQQMLDESSEALATNIQAATEAGQASVAAVGGLQTTGAQLQGTIRTLSVVAGVLILGCIVLAVLVPRVIVRNLVKVVGAMRAMAQGDFTNNLEIQARDEVGELGDELNRMMEQLRETIRSVVSVSVELASASEELSATTTQIATGSEEMGSQSQGVASAATQMAATVGEVARSAQSVSEVSEAARTAASDGGQVISKALGAFSRIQTVVASAAKLVDTLGEQSRQIGGVVEVIEDIADQTNLLALNAAIEAARAGEHGRGFAVVADEVRKLAEKTVKATKEISSTIQAIQGDAVKAVDAMRDGQETVASGSELAGQAGTAVQEIEDAILRTSEQVSQIAAGTEEMSVTIQELASNMDEIAKGVDHTVSATGEISRTADTMASQAEELRNLSGKFKV